MDDRIVPRAALAVLGLGLLLGGCAHVWPSSLYYLDRDPDAALAAGATAPAFALESVEGKRVSLDVVRAGGNPVLVFYRGHW